MKHLIHSMTLLAIATILFASCKKEYTCECYVIPGKTEYREYKIKAVNAKKAKQECGPSDAPPPELYCGLK